MAVLFPLGDAVWKWIIDINKKTETKGHTKEDG